MNDKREQMLDERCSRRTLPTPPECHQTRRQSHASIVVPEATCGDGCPAVARWQTPRMMLIGHCSWCSCSCFCSCGFKQELTLSLSLSRGTARSFESPSRAPRSWCPVRKRDRGPTRYFEFRSMTYAMPRQGCHGLKPSGRHFPAATQENSTPEELSQQAVRLATTGSMYFFVWNGVPSWHGLTSLFLRRLIRWHYSLSTSLCFGSDGGLVYYDEGSLTSFGGRRVRMQGRNHG